VLSLINQKADGITVMVTEIEETFLHRKTITKRRQV
jgi:hypothetical protein